jgi:hypothetical protein
VRVKNRSEHPWPNDIPAGRHVCLGNHWIHEDGGHHVYDDARAFLPRAIEPGETVEMSLGVRPQPLSADTSSRPISSRSTSRGSQEGLEPSACGRSCRAACRKRAARRNEPGWRRRQTAPMVNRSVLARIGESSSILRPMRCLVVIDDRRSGSGSCAACGAGRQPSKCTSFPG